MMIVRHLYARTMFFFLQDFYNQVNIYPILSSELNNLIEKDAKTIMLHTKEKTKRDHLCCIWSDSLISSTASFMSAPTVPFVSHEYSLALIHCLYIFYIMVLYHHKRHIKRGTSV